MIVVDASALVDLLLHAPGFRALKKRLFSDPSWHAPQLIDLEVTHALRRREATGRVSARRAAYAVDILPKLPLTRWPHLPFVPRIWNLRANVKAYDAAYISLAEALDVPLITRDERIARAPGHRARIELID